MKTHYAIVVLALMLFAPLVHADDQRNPFERDPYWANATYSVMGVPAPNQTVSLSGPQVVLHPEYIAIAVIGDITPNNTVQASLLIDITKDTLYLNGEKFDTSEALPEYREHRMWEVFAWMEINGTFWATKKDGAFYLDQIVGDDLSKYNAHYKTGLDHPQEMRRREWAGRKPGMNFARKIIREQLDGKRRLIPLVYHEELLEHMTGLENLRGREVYVIRKDGQMVRYNP